MRVPDVVLFDLDGTLTDPRIGITLSYQHALATVGIIVDDPDSLTWCIGPPLRENLASFGLEGELLDQAVDAYRDRHHRIGVYEATVIPGMPELLADLREVGRRLAVATSKRTDQADLTVDHFRFRPYLEAVAGADPDAGRVQKADVVGHALRLLGDPDPRTCVLVGDRRHDVDGGKACGLATIGVTWGYAEPGELEAAAPDAIATTVGELRALLLPG